MVCGCRVPVEQYPENAEWGPLFWTLLHGLAEYAGKQQGLLQMDELRLWQNLLKSLQPTLPCDICRGHYAEKLAGSEVDKLLSISYPTFGGCFATIYGISIMKLMKEMINQHFRLKNSLYNTRVLTLQKRGDN